MFIEEATVSDFVAHLWGENISLLTELGALSTEKL
jgi:hypothetical protein